MLKLTRRDVREISTGVLFLLPNILGFLAFTTIPLAISLFMAFTDWNLEMHNMFQNQELRSVGFANFAKLFSDPDFPTFLGKTLFLMLGIPFGIAGSLFAALLLNNDFRCSRMKRVYGAVVLTVVLIVACGMLILAGAGSTAMTLLICGIVGTVLVLGSVGGQTVYRTLFYGKNFTARKTVPSTMFFSRCWTGLRLLRRPSLRRPPMCFPRFSWSSWDSFIPMPCSV